MNPFELDLLALPSVTLEQRSLLPTTPCIYFAIDGQGVVQYIGQSVNPKRRWLNHHKGIELGGMSGARIAYLSVDAPELLLEIEQALIKWFNPPLNGNSLANLIDRSAADNPGDTTATTVRIGTEDLEWLKSLPEGTSYHLRQAVKQYRKAYVDSVH